ncbi:hypothetical protein FACS189449_12190 [Alphaproteobacteria bacterium]|nr:hypothetical protein FACS189449_12190 [Alphaproteobacteria bacterium]
MRSGIFNLIVAFSLLVGCSEKSIVVEKPREMQRAVSIQTIEDFGILLEKEIQQHNPHDILVVFDFNYTLLYPADPALCKKNMEKHKVVFTKLLKTLSKKEADLLFSNVTKTSNQKAVSNKSASLIRNFKKQGVNFIVCTGSLTKTGEKNSADIIANLLKVHDIDLSSDAFPFAHLDFREFKSYLGSWPSYSNGIITANRENKGAVLSSFMKKLEKKPEVVVFVDNSPKKIGDVLKIADSFAGVKFVVCKYDEYQNVAVPEISEQEFLDFWNRKIAETKSLDVGKTLGIG